MPEKTVIILDEIYNKSVSKSINLHPEYDLKHVNYHYYDYNYNLIIKRIKVEK